MTTAWPVPASEEIVVPRSEELTFAELDTIAEQTGVDVLAAPARQGMAAIIWFGAQQLPAWAGVPYEVVRTWPVRVMRVVPRYEDTSSVLAAAAALPIEPDPVIPEDGAPFRPVHPAADRRRRGDGDLDA